MAKKNTKRQTLLRVSSEVFAKVGFGKAKMSDITKEAGMATGTAYLYFQNKEQILKELLVEYWSIVFQYIKNASDNPSLTASQKISNSVVNIVDRAVHFPEISKLVLLEFNFWNDPQNIKLKQIIDETKVLLKGIIERGIESGEFLQPIIPEIAVSFIIGGVWHLLEFSFLNNESYETTVLKEQAEILVSNLFS